MAGIREAVRSRLNGDATLTTPVGSRIRPNRIPQNETMPAIRHQVVSNPRVSAMGSDTGIARARVQVDCFPRSSRGRHGQRRGAIPREL